MEWIFWIGIGIAIFTIIGVGVQARNNEIGDVVVTAIVGVLMVGCLMYLSGLLDGYKSKFDAIEKYQQAILDGTYEIKTIHELELTEDGDTIKYETRRKVVLPEKENKE